MRSSERNHFGNFCNYHQVLCCGAKGFSVHIFLITAESYDLMKHLIEVSLLVFYDSPGSLYFILPMLSMMV